MGTLPDEESAQEARPSGYESQGRFLSFAFRVAKNAWIDRHRRSAYRPRLVGGTEDEGTPIDRAVSPDDGPAETATAGEEAARIRAAVRSLPDSHRLVFELGVIEERPYAEISEILSIPVGTVKSRMHNAVRKVRAVLERSTDASETPRARRTPR